MINQASRTLLIVDDSPEDRELYRRYLQRDREYTYTILEASLGYQGLELWRQHQPDVMLLDYRLPDLDGLDFLAQLQQSLQQPWLPVLVVTRYGNEAIAVQAMKAGAQDYLIKEQITPEGLQMAVNGAIASVQLRTQLQATQAQLAKLEELNQLKDEFLSTVSHELRSPMSSIKMATQMLKVSLDLQTGKNQSEPPSAIVLNQAQTAKVAHYLTILDSECQREARLINDLLDLTRLDADTLSLELTEIALQSWVPQVAEAFIERTQQRQQQLELHIPAGLPPCTTNRSALERILTELLENACKYTPSHEKISVTIGASTPSFTIAVSNSGVEISHAEYDRIFEKFYRIPNNDPWKHGGTGLGLALVKKLVDCLQGSIDVSSGHNWTTFTVTLPWQLEVGKRVGGLTSSS